MTRSGPVGLAQSDPARASEYRAALQQFEELIRAAESTGPASRPLPLFYALTQAGRAIVAVRGGPAHHGHGLTLGPLDTSALDTEVSVSQSGRSVGHYQAVAQALASPPLNGRVKIGALLASLPEMADTLLLHDDWPRAIAVFERDPGLHVPTPGWLHVTIVVDDLSVDLKRLLTLLADYPAVQGRIGTPSAVGSLPFLPSYSTPEGNGVGVMFKGNIAELDAAAPQYRIYGRRWLRPAIAGSSPPQPTMTWWALLYALSMYARYHPREWVAALDIDSSPVGVTLERVMDRALDALPHLVLDGVLPNPFLLPAIHGAGPDPFGQGRL